MIVAFFIAFYLNGFGQTSRPKNMPGFDAMPAHLGYSVGMSIIGFTYIPQDGIDVTVRQNPGINLNIVTNVRLGKYLDFRFLPGIQFGQRDILIKDLTNPTVAAFDARIESVFIDLPFLIKYRAERVNNYAPYLIAGVNPRLDITGGEIEDWKPAQRLIRAFDVYPELGVGLDFYLAKVKISSELKFAVGLLDLYFPPPDEPEYDLYSRAFEKIMSRMVIFSINIG